MEQINEIKDNSSSLEEKVDIPVEEELIVKYKTEQIICKGEELKEIKKLADNIYEVFLELDGYKLTLPIKKINGLCCDAIIDIHKNKPEDTRYFIIFKIESPKLFEEEDGDLVNKNYYYENFGYIHEDEFDKDTHILHYLIKIKYLLSNLQYCYGSNRLTLTTNDNLELFTSVFESPNLEMICDKCCVCLTTTTNKTKCKHSLCFICWEQIKFIRTDENEEHINCPMCRENIEIID
jgi:hypothetical protein